MSVKVTEIERRLASEISKHKGRSAVMVSQLGIHKLAAKRIYKEVNGRTPPSGLSPDSTLTTFQAINRLQSSLLLDLYEKALSRLVTNSENHQMVIDYERAFEAIDEFSSTEERCEAAQLAAKVCTPQFYESCKKKIYSERCHAFISSFSMYARLCGDNQRLDINRFDFLIRDSYKLADLKTGRKVINWTKCVTCKAKILKQYHEVSVECPHCSGGLNRSRNLVDAFRDKAISRALPRI